MPGLRWYAVNTYSGQETKALQNLRDRIRNSQWKDRFGEILVPTGSDLEDAGLPARGPSADGKFHPGLLLVQVEIDMEDKIGGEIFKLITTTPMIVGFTDATRRPNPLRGKGKFGKPDNSI